MEIEAMNPSNIQQDQTVIFLKNENECQRKRIEELEMENAQLNQDMTNMARLCAELKDKNQELADKLQKKEAELIYYKKHAYHDSSEDIFSGLNNPPVSGSTGEGTQETEEQEQTPSSEKTSDTTTPEDAATTGEPQEDGSAPGKVDGRHTGNHNKKGSLIRHKMAELPQYDNYNLTLEDIQRLDETYGENGWRIIKWEKTPHLEVIPRLVFTQNDYRPVISVREDNNLSTLMRLEQQCPYFYPGSPISPSCFASFVHDKFGLALPLYRQEGEMDRMFRLGFYRSTIARALIKGSNGFAGVVAQYMGKLVSNLAYQQSDETYTQCLMLEGDCYYWVHVTGELCPDDPQIAYFCFEETRKAEHLRKYFPEDFACKLACDCYSGYVAISKENTGIVLTNCWMHVRRRFVYAFLLKEKVIGVANIELLKSTDEFIFLDIIRKMYHLDTPVKTASPEVRLSVRQEEIKPIVDEIMQLGHNFNLEDPAQTDIMKDAVSYMLEHEQELREFLTDPSVPIDNGFCERTLRPLTIGRKNWLFSDSVDGAVAVGVYYTLVQTARMNDANDFIYIQYLAEKMPGGILGPTVSLSDEFMETMMPWSEEYKLYESQMLSGLWSKLSLVSPELPVVSEMRKTAYGGDSVA